MKLNWIQRITLVWWSLRNDPRLNQYSKNLDCGMNKQFAYKQAVAFAPSKHKFSHREISAGHIILDDGVPTKVLAVTYDHCVVLDANHQPLKLDWKDVRPIEMNMNWLIHFGFECQATLWTIIDSGFWITQFKDGWYVMDVKNQKRGDKINHVHQLQDVFQEKTGYQLAIT